MKDRLFNKRIPTILGIVLVLSGILLTTLVINSQTIFKSNATNSQEPKNVKVTNVSDQSFTITYQTESPSTGSISYGPDKKLGESGLEDADKKTGSFTPRKIHSISVNKLTPDTKYFLAIISGSNTYLDKESPFETTTGPSIASPSANKNSVKGKIVLPDGSIPSEALVYLSAEGSQLLSGLTDKDGKFNFSLKDLRTDNLSSYFETKDNTVLTIISTDGSLESTTLVTINQSDSIPVITQSNNYDFTQEAPAIATKSATKLPGFPSVSPPAKNLKPQILSPEKNQSLTTQKPQFRGTGLPNEKVEIIIHSDEQITAQVTTDNNGNWTFIPPANLSPGNHTITIKSRDSSGILTSVVQSFTVFATGSQASGSATPSATPIPTPIIMPLIITPAPTKILIPSPTPAFIQTFSKGVLPPTGDLKVIPASVAAVATTIVGIVLFLLTKRMPL